ncbi:GNAT family N-acetyltransferase [Arcticibacterium luteifluviistationis]|uniref:GNAT family N-acetyltransferase n=1 Tax=Arcticibacterium luteifluviistationis TaxID=1784714 RepID=A0A2Z4GCQ6_9BACT|nr:GNAT family N-acetyltransferase [Arcticibacterium luteifluviistationis]AWV98815.1 GNAT family N-acetyltransferase [Arcticibacterium luteifluviistationis]
MSNAIEIIRTDTSERKGIFTAYLNGLAAGEMTYTWAGTQKFIIDHTGVNDGFNGRGIGKELVKAGVAFARKENVKIMPLCPFAKSYFDKHQAIHDVLYKVGG